MHRLREPKERKLKMTAPATTNAVRLDKPSRRRFALMTAARHDASRLHHHTPHITAIEEELRAMLAVEVRRETQQFVAKFTAEVETLHKTLVEHGVHTEETLQGIQALVANLTDQLQSIARS